MAPGEAEYFSEVMKWGNEKPWKVLEVRLKHTSDFGPSDVITDGSGNITSMPLLIGKPCFARPEVFFRHGRRTRIFRDANGIDRLSSNHQCGRCPIGVWEACGRTSYERIQSDLSMKEAFAEWRDVCAAAFGGDLVCTGVASLSWGAFKKAIAHRGRFENSNIQAIRDAEECERLEKNERNASRKATQRAKVREACVQGIEDGSSGRSLDMERDRRREALLEVLGKRDQHPSLAKVPANKCQATAAITANAWMVREMLVGAGEVCNPGRIANYMAKNGLSEGLEYPTLKARMASDLKRITICERLGVWV